MKKLISLMVVALMVISMTGVVCAATDVDATKAYIGSIVGTGNSRAYQVVNTIKVNGTNSNVSVYAGASVDITSTIDKMGTWYTNINNRINEDVVNNVITTGIKDIMYSSNVVGTFAITIDTSDFNGTFSAPVAADFTKLDSTIFEVDSITQSGDVYVCNVKVKDGVQVEDLSAEKLSEITFTKNVTLPATAGTNDVKISFTGSIKFMSGTDELATMTFTSPETTRTISTYVQQSGGSSSTSKPSTDNTVKNDDGSTTTTTTDKNGTVTVTTKRPDGSTTTTETKKDGTVTETNKDTEGNKSETVTNPDGSSVTKEENKDGSEKVVEKDTEGTVTTTEKDKDGNTKETVEKADGSMTSTETKTDGTTVKSETTSDGNTTAEVELPKDGTTTVEIPVAPGQTVEKITFTDNEGNVTEITEFETTDNGISFEVSTSGKIEVTKSEDAPAKEFVDVQPTSHWAKEAIEYVVKKGLMNGVSETEFAPDSNLTRGMLVTILYRLAEEPETSNKISFNDVVNGAYYEEAVKWAMENDIVKGFSDDEFAPDINITREQIATILYRYAKSVGYDVTQGGMKTREFDDYSDISDYALEAMTWAVNAGLINGRENNMIASKDFATRAEIATIIYRFIELNK